MSKDATTCTSALAQLDELIKDKDKVVLLGERMDPLLVSCYMQLRDVLYIKLRMDNANPKEVLRLFQVLQLVHSFFQSELIKHVAPQAAQLGTVVYFTTFIEMSLLEGPDFGPYDLL